MAYNFKTVKETTEKRPTSPFLSPGSGLVLKINNIELVKSQNSGNPRPVFHMESEAITEADFKPVDGAAGRVGKVSGNGGYYLNNDNQRSEFLGFLKAIARAIGRIDELEAIEANSFEDLVDRSKRVLCGHYARYFVSGTEFSKPEGRWGVKLTFPNKRAVESVDQTPTTLEAFDFNNPKHYKAVPHTQQDGFGVAQGSAFTPKTTTSNKTDDLPF